jgi:ABC-2 type transport system ATP-binding protein
VIAAGELAASGTPGELKARVRDRTVVEVETFGIEEAVLERLRQLEGVASVATETREHAVLVLVQSRTGAELVQRLLRELDSTNVGRVITREPTLEDAYVELVQAS